MNKTEKIKILLNLSEPDYKRWDALIKLKSVKMDNYVVDSLMKALAKDPNAVIRHDAAFILGERKVKQAHKLLCKMALKDKSPLVRHEATESLVDLPFTDEAKKTLNILLKDNIKEARETAQIVLGLHESSK